MSAAWTIFRRELALVAGWVTFAIFLTYGESMTSKYASPTVAVPLFLWLFVVMLWCAINVVRHAEAVAELVGEPYGTLILTVSVIGIEVSLIASIMIGGGENPTLARDTMFAAVMIALNGLVGISLLIGAFRHSEQSYNISGAKAFLTVIIPLSVFSLILPDYTTSTSEPTFSVLQTVVFSIAIAMLYLVFLAIQTTRHAAYFREPEHSDTTAADSAHHSRHVNYSLMVHFALLVLILLPIVLLSKKLAIFADYGIEEIGLPVALGGVLIALLVMAAEGISAVRAAYRNQLQRSVNLCLGSALSTIGLTAPAVLVIGLLFDRTVILGLDPVEQILLGVTFLVSILTFGGTRTNLLQGAVHMILFLAYLALIFDP